MYRRVTVNKTCDQILCMAVHTYTTNTCCCFHFSLLGITYTASVCCLNLYKYHIWGESGGGGVSCWPARTVAGVCTNKFLACIFVVLVHDMHHVCDASAVHQRPLYINSSNNSQLLILPPELKPREREREMSQWWN